MADVVIGAGGGTGLACVKRLLALGRQVRAVVRDPSKYTAELNHEALVGPAAAAAAAGKLEVVAGDVGDKASVRAALSGAAGVIFAASGKGYWTADAVDCQVRV